ncbi:MAG: phytoene desaturase family protein [Bacteroidetes bacterium]|nr:phytoene desaturase family protein [Bacteroidota bacterium]MDA0888934.1 phytoene desaturase family protein [Bacteroidota bacterium]MDA1085244.1 phytoene desaturase family protein [Bacteroidota bacterium]
MKKIVIIGSGFSSLSAACYLAKKGYTVQVLEKNDSLGGRARQFKKEGFTFDMGPSWYWMPDVFESFFADFGKQVSDYYQLDRLSPGYQVIFGKDDVFPVEDSIAKIAARFDEIEPGSGAKLERFLAKARNNYDIAVKDLVYRPGVSPLELVTPQTVRKVGLFFTNIRKQVEQQFKNPKLRSLLQFPVLFLGAKPESTPAFYNFMNYADFGLGTWHPKGGMYQIVDGMVTLGKSLGVSYHTSHGVDEILLNGGKACGVRVGTTTFDADIVISGADYHHTETLLPKEKRAYSEAYWDKKTFAPSSLLFYIGLDKKLDALAHHNLFFDVDFDAHANSIYDTPEWPDKPLFYVNLPSQSDPLMAPKGKEACFILIPIAPDLEDTPELRQQYFDIVLERMEQLTDTDIKPHILFNESFCVKDFKEVYNSYKGNAYGMANTLLQTAFLRPKMKSKTVDNLYFTGQLTVPGPGVPPALISGKIVSEFIG